jgi:hypothetical protein
LSEDVAHIGAAGNHLDLDGRSVEADRDVRSVSESEQGCLMDFVDLAVPDLRDQVLPQPGGSLERRNDVMLVVPLRVRLDGKVGAAQLLDR